MKIGLWIIALFVGSVLWGMMVNATSYGGRSLALSLGAGIGSGGVVFLATGVVALIVRAFQRFDPSKRHVAMWTWTVTLLIGLIFASLGHAHLMSLR